MKNFDYVQYVSELNEKFYKKEFFLNFVAPYQYITDGYSDAIVFLDYEVFSTGNDMMYDDDNNIIVDSIVMKKSKEILDNLNSVFNK